MFSLRYDGETLIKEVNTNFILLEQHGRTGYIYSTTMKQVHYYRCIASLRGVKKERSKRSESREGKGTTLLPCMLFVYSRTRNFLARPLSFEPPSRGLRRVYY